MCRGSGETDAKLVISKFYKDKLLAFYFYKDKLQRISNMDSDSVVGNIYCGYVKDVVKNINAAFIEFGDNLKGYYSLNDNVPLFLNNKNSDTLCQGDRILVQVSGDKIKTKDYSLTSKINLTGEFVVLTVGNTNISISKKINDPQERKKLGDMLSQYKNEEFGFIVRTSCQGAGEEDVLKEAEKLIKEWKTMKEKAFYLTGKSVVKSVSQLTIECREFLQKEQGLIVTDDLEVYEKLTNENINVNFYNSQLPMEKCYSLETLVTSAVNKHVWLKSGAYLIIEPTEALTVVDVNTGKAELKTKREETFFEINLEAAKEISRQLKIRNISGMIVVDFISMKDKSKESELLGVMNELLKYDYTRAIAVGMTNLGLMEITRKKRKKSIYEIVNSISER